MNILIDIRLLGRGGTSGIHEYTQQIVSHLLGLDSKNRYLLFYNGFRKEPLTETWTEKKQVTILDWKIPNRLLDASARLLNYPKLDHYFKADLVFSPHFNILLTDRPRLITFHDLSFLHHPYFFGWRQKFWHWLQDYRSQASRASRIIVSSEFTKADLINALRLPEEKISVIYHGINPEFKKLSPDDENLKTFKKKNRLDFPFLLYLGTLEPRKNIPAIIRAFGVLKSKAQFKDLRLVVAGRPGWLYQDILKTAAESPFREQIIFLGPVENRERVLLYNLAEVFVYPSFFEGFGFPPLEAQACGTPVIVANRTSLPEIIGSSGLTIDPWRIDELAHAIEMILTDSQFKKRLTEAGLENSKKFSWQKAAQKLLNLFKEYE